MFKAIAVFACLLLSFSLSAQNDLDSGITHPVGAKQLSVPLGALDLETGNMSLDIPLYTLRGREVGASGVHFRYNSNIWSEIPFNAGSYFAVMPVSGWTLGVEYSTPQQNAVAVDLTTLSCPPNYNGTYLKAQRFETRDPDGTIYGYFLPEPVFYNSCVDSANRPQENYGANSGAVRSLDGSHFLEVKNFSYYRIFDAKGWTAETTNGNNSTGGYNSSTGEPLDNLGGTLSSCYLSVQSGFELGAGLSSGADQTYTPKDPKSCSWSVPSADGTGGSISFSQTYSYIPICTNFVSPDAPGAYGRHNYCGGLWVLTTIHTPTGDYAFGYDQGQDPGHNGQLISVTLPTGGQINYTYNTLRYNWPHYYQGLQSVTYGGGQTTIGYTPQVKNTPYQGYTTNYPITVTYPNHAVSSTSGAVTDQSTYDMVFTGQNDNGVAGYLKRVDSVAGTNVVESDTDSALATPSYDQTTWLETGDVLRNDYTYVNQQIQSVKTSLNGSVLRTKQISYQQDTASVSYQSQYHMVAYPTSVIVTDGNNAVVAETDTTYDEYSSNYCQNSGGGGVAGLSEITGAVGHDDTHGASWFARGNPTTMVRKSFKGTDLVQHMCYDTLGNVTATVDGKSNITQYGYADNYADRSCVASGNTYAQRTSTTNALNQASATQYNSCLRVPVKVQDPNDLAASRSGTQYSFYADGRPHCTNVADGGQSCSSDSINSITTTASAAGTITKTLDGYGRLSSTVTSESGIEVDYGYDGSSRLSSVSNPYSTTQTGAPDKTLMFYDGLGRKTSTSAPDGSSTNWSYSGPNVTVTDEVGNARTLAYDAASRLTSVTEPNSRITTYSYDALDNVTGVTQQGTGQEGTRSRSFSYDGNSQLLAAQNPERGATQTCAGAVGSSWSDCYVYDANGNPTVKTDARGATVSYSYDALNRLASKVSSFNGLTKNVCFQYDGVPSSAVPNSIGRLVAEWTQNNSCPTAQSSVPVPSATTWKNILAYDSVGRVLQEKQCAHSPCTDGLTVASLQYMYDLAGNLTYSTNGVPSQRWPSSGTPNPQIAINLGYDGAGRLQSVANNADISRPGNLLYNNSFDGFGPTSWAQGFTKADQSDNVLAGSAGHDNRGRLNSLTATASLNSSNQQPTAVANVSPNNVPLGNAGYFTIVCNNCGDGSGTVYLDGARYSGFTYTSGSPLSGYLPNNLSAGSHTLRVDFSPAGSQTAISNQTSFTVSQQNLPSTVVTVTPSNQSVPLGEGTQITISVNCNTACGTGHYGINGQWGGGFTLDGTGQAVINVAPSQLPATGSYTITAFYNGNASFASSDNTANPATFNVVPNNLPVPNINVAIDRQQTPQGEWAQITFTVGCSSACGNGYYLINGNWGGGFVLDSTGRAVVGVRPEQIAAVGNYNIVTYYGGNSQFSDADTTNSPTVLTVVANNLPKPSVTVSVTPQNIPLGEYAQATIHVSCGACGNGYLYANGSYAGGFSLDQSGNAVLDLPPWVLTNVQRYNIVAQYFGDSNNAPADNTSLPGIANVVQNTLPKPSVTATVDQPLVKGNVGTAHIQVSCNSACGSGHYFTDGNYAGGFVLDSSGHADVAIYPQSTPDAKHYTLTVFYFGNSSYSQNDNTASPTGFDVSAQ